MGWLRRIVNQPTSHVGRAEVGGDLALPCGSMSEPDPEVMVCRDLDRAIALFSRLGFRLDSIYPADDPAVASLSGHGALVRLLRAGRNDVLEVRGEIDDAVPALRPAFGIAYADGATWRTGRAGMQ